MRRESRRPKVVLRFEPLEARSLLSADLTAPGSPAPAASAPLMVAVISSGADINVSDPVHVLGDAKYFDFGDGYNAVDGTSGESAVADADPSKEGTRLFSQILQGIEDAVAAGGSSNVEVVPIRDYQSPTAGVPFYALIGAIDHAVDIGARVIDVNYTAGQNALDASQVQQLQQAFAYAQSKNAVVVVPAGDGYGSTSGGLPVGVNLDQSGANRVLYPAQFHEANMLVVAATDSAGNLGSISDWGPVHVDIGAPIALANRVTGLATGYATGVAAVVAASRTDWSAVAVVNRIKLTAQPEAALTGKVTSGGMLSPTRALAGIAGAVAPLTPSDYEGDLKSDFAIYGNIPSLGGYGFSELSSTQGFSTSAPTLINNAGSGFGGPGSIPVSGNYYGDGTTHPAIYGPEYNSSGQRDGKYDFAILSQNSVGQYFVTTYVAGIGSPGDIPIVADFDGDGKTDLGLYGDHNGQYNFEVLTAASNFNPSQMLTLNNNGQGYGGPGSVPVVGDFFGDGKADPAVYGPQFNANGQPDGKYDFAALDPGSLNASGQYTRGLFVSGIGQAGDIPIVGDFTGDGRSDLALYGDHNGQYNFQVLTAASGFNPNQMLTLNNNGQGYGGPGSVPVAGDFFGDGGTDLAVYGPEFNPNGQPNGKYDLAAIDLKSKNAQGQPTKSLFIPNFGTSTTIPASAPPVVKWFDGQSD